MSIHKIIKSNINSDRAFQKLVENVKSNNLTVAQGLFGTSKCVIVGNLYNAHRQSILVLTSTTREAEEFYQDLKHFFPDIPIEIFPTWDMLPYEHISPFPDSIHHRVMVLHRIVSEERLIVVSSVQAAIQNIIPAEDFKKQHLEVKTGDEMPYELLLEQLVHLGYKRTPMVEGSGEFSVKGDIIDVFPSSLENPIRIDFFGDTIEKIRQFDAISQRTIKETGCVDILPQREIIYETDNVIECLSALENRFKTSPEKSEIEEYLDNKIYFNGVEHLIPLFYPPFTLFDYMEDTLVVFNEKDRIKKAEDRIHFEAEEIYKASHKRNQIKPSPDEIYQKLESKMFTMKSLELYFLTHFDSDNAITFKTGTPEGFRDNIARLPDFIMEKIDQGFTIIVLASYEGQMKRLKEIFAPDLTPALAGDMLPDKGIQKEKDLSKEKFIIATGSISTGFILYDSPLYLILDREIFGRKRSFFKKIHKVNSSPIQSFMELSRGDYVVHINYGIGKFQGIERILAHNKEKDYIKIIYADDEKLYIPIEQMNLVQKYIGGSGKTPKLDKLGSKSWDKTRERVKKSLEKMAGELAKLYKARLENKGIVSSEDTEWQIKFETAFEYEETPDQLTAIEQVKKDMEKPICMDRLICGDVGYGKTEVAMRACFKAVMSGYQVAVLVPTTILAEQHLETFKERFRDFPVDIRMMSRFCTGKEIQSAIQGIKKGQVDIVIGTHKLLSDKIEFKNLGLIVIDEEQKFGVKHKEKLKKYRAMVDVISLSATPIPRTLHMSLTDIRDFSVINTPPENRLPIDTFIMEFNENIIKDAINREIKRDGQVFFVHNRVKTIQGFGGYLQELFPRLNIGIAHGRMEERELEEVMHNFIQKKYHILVCTTIIESGLDIPNANTILIDRADKLGLSQMYQLRGRVGRSKEKAYCYLFYPEDFALTEIAQKRLAAIREFTDLGSGFKIAMRDLEIRGAGNILGPEQSGDIASVGFELYCKLLKETVESVLGGEEYDTLETFVDLRYDGYIPDTYIPDEKQKFEIYKKIVGCVNNEDVEAVKRELIDRFGAFPPIVNTLLKFSHLKVKAKKIRVVSIVETDLKILIEFDSANNLNVTQLLELVNKTKNLSLNPHKPNSIEMLISEDDNLERKMNLLQDFFQKINLG